MKKSETKKLKGVCRIYDDDSIDFTPYGEGVQIQKDVKKSRKSKMYCTEGDNGSYIMHLKVDKNAVDPVSELCDDFEKLLKNIEPKKKPKLKGKTLYENENCSVVLNKPQKRIEVRMILELSEDRSYTEDYYTMNYLIQRCFSINKDSIQNVLKSPLKSSKESSTTKK